MHPILAIFSPSGSCVSCVIKGLVVYVFCGYMNSTATTVHLHLELDSPHNIVPVFWDSVTCCSAQHCQASCYRIIQERLYLPFAVSFMKQVVLRLFFLENKQQQQKTIRACTQDQIKVANFLLFLLRCYRGISVPHCVSNI